MYGNTSVHSVKTRMGHLLPPISSRQQSHPWTNQFTHSQLSTHSSTTPPNLYLTPHQDAPGPLSGPPNVLSALTIPVPPYAPPPALSHRAGYAMSQYPLAQTHPPLYTVLPSPPFVFPLHPGLPGGEASMQHLAYTSYSMIPVLQQPYHSRSIDSTPSSHQTYAAGTFIRALPVYPHFSVFPPPSSPLASRQTSTASSSEMQRLTTYPSPTTYSPMGYTTPPPFVYPTPFVPPPSIYGSHHPSHYAQPYGSPPRQENHAGWRYPPSGVTVTRSSFREPRARSQSHSDYQSPVYQNKSKHSGKTSSASPTSSLAQTGKYPSRNRVGSPSDTRTNTASASTHLSSSSTSDTQPSTEEVLSREGGRDSHQQRRSYHPKTPVNRSEWVLWAGNVPSDATADELRIFFNRPPPPLSPSQPRSSTEPQQVYGGVTLVFLVARSNCAFVNFEFEAQLEAAMTRFHGEPIRLDDPRCPRLVCRVRTRTDDLNSGVGAQRGSSMHVNWIKEQRAKKARSPGADSQALFPAAECSSSPLSISDDDGKRRSTSSCSSHSGSLASTNSDILSRNFPRRYFILKSLTQHDLDQSVQRGVWATQRHNEEIVCQAYRTSKDVFLIFGVNKSGEFYGYARMAGPIQQSEDRVPLTSRSAFPASAAVARESTVGEVQGNVSTFLSESPVEGHQIPHSLSRPEEHRVVEQSRKSNSRPPKGPSFSIVRVSSAPPELYGFHLDVPHSSQITRIGSPRHGASIPLMSFSLELNADAPYHAVRDTADQCSHEEAHPAVPSSPGEHGVSERAQDAALNTSDAAKDASNEWAPPFRVEWIRTTRLSFFRTRHLRNPWNHGYEVRVSRDGTELEPSIGRQLLEEWDKHPLSPTDVPATSCRTSQ